MKDTIEIPRSLLEDLLENTYDLRATRQYWKGEERCNRDYAYQTYCKEIEQVEALLNPPKDEPEEDPRQMNLPI